MGGFCLRKIKIPFFFFNKQFHCAEGTVSHEYTVRIVNEKENSPYQEEYIMGEIVFSDGKIFEQPLKLKRRKREPLCFESKEKVKSILQSRIDSFVENKCEFYGYMNKKVLVIELIKDHPSVYIEKNREE